MGFALLCLRHVGDAALRSMQHPRRFEMSILPSPSLLCLCGYQVRGGGRARTGIATAGAGALLSASTAAAINAPVAKYRKDYKAPGHWTRCGRRGVLFGVVRCACSSRRHSKLLFERAKRFVTVLATPSPHRRHTIKTLFGYIFNARAVKRVGYRHVWGLVTLQAIDITISAPALLNHILAAEPLSKARDFGHQSGGRSLSGDGRARPRAQR